jgi:putative FmdB family regulatory protein
MPIYEFKCLDCNEVLEILFVRSDDSAEIRCKACGSEHLERILSAASHAMAPSAGGGASSGAPAQTRSCSSGSCSTWTLPGGD